MLHSFLIEKTQIPVLKLKSNESMKYKKIDINFSIDYDNPHVKNPHQGLQAVKLVKRYMSAYAVLRPLVLVLKQIMYCSYANNPYKGGLSSYALILMVIAYLQQK